MTRGEATTWTVIKGTHTNIHLRDPNPRPIVQSAEDHSHLTAGSHYPEMSVYFLSQH